MFLDFRKAFDTIKWNYLLSTLRLFNFGLDIQRWIEVIYHNVSSCVLNNGHASPFFQLHRGVRQGCPLSGLLFVIGIELLTRALKSNNDIKGITVGGKEIKVTQFADDTTNNNNTLFLKNACHASLNAFYKDRLKHEDKNLKNIRIWKSKS